MTTLTQSRRHFLTTLLMASGTAAINWTGMKALASSIPEKERIPVVVIGAGLGGLVSAAYLSQYGFDVTLLEQHSIPGGYATTFERGDFTFDVSLHATVAEHGRPQMILKELGIWDQLDLVHTPELMRIVTPRFDVTLPARNPEGVKNSLTRVFPHEKKGIHQFYSQMEQVIFELRSGKRFKASMIKMLDNLTLEQWMNLNVSDPDVKRCLASFGGYYCSGPNEVSALFYAVATGEYLVYGGQYYKTRSQDLSDALVASIQKNNGKIFYNTQIDHIVFDNDDAVAGVKDSAGKMYPAKSVIANCSVPALINKMLSKHLIPEPFEQQVMAREPSVSSFVVWLGLNKEIRHIKDYEIAFSDQKQLGRNLNLPNENPLEADFMITVYDNLFKGYSVPGKSILSFTFLPEFEPWKKFEKDYFNGRKEAYNLEKQKIADRLVQRVQKALIPNLSDMIEVMEIGTPLTNKFYTGNPGGEIYGFNRKMVPLKSRTPIRGLYLSSAWSHGGGYSLVMMAGRDSAGAMLKDFS